MRRLNLSATEIGLIVTYSARIEATIYGTKTITWMRDQGL